MGSYTTNSYFYKPALGESGTTNLALFDAALDATDTELNLLNAHRASTANPHSTTLTHVTSGLTAPVTDVLDEDNMASDSATKLCTQQSIKKYVDDAIAGVAETDTLQAVFDRGQTITIADTDDQTLLITQNDVTNNPTAVSIVNAGTGAGLSIQQTGSGDGIFIDNNSNDDCISVDWDITNEDDAGAGFEVTKTCTVSDAGTHTSNDTLLKLTIEKVETSGTFNISSSMIAITNPGTGVAMHITTATASQAILKFTTNMGGDSAKDPTNDAPADWLQIDFGGTQYYIPVYAAS